MTGPFRRLRVVALLALAIGLSGCVGSPSASDSSDRLHQQAQADLARWDAAVASAGGQTAFVPTGELTGQVGDWEEAVGSNNKMALMSGVIEAAVPLPAETPPDGQVRWQDGTGETVALVSAQQAFADIKADSVQPCPECVPLQITGAQLASGSIETSRGLAEAPMWQFAVQGTAVLVTRVAIAARVNAVPPTWDPYDPNNQPVGISIRSATGTVGGRQLTVSLVGAQGPATEACGADYSAEAVESSTAIVVIVTEHRHNGGIGEACSDVGYGRTAEVELAAPLGDRAVLEVREGQPVPVALTGPVGAKAPSPSPMASPSSDSIGLGVVNATDLQVSLVVNGTVIKTFAPGGADKAIYVNALPSLPWAVEARTSSGRVLATMTVQTMSDRKESGADLSCGQLYMWSGPTEPSWPAPQPGSSGDCLP